MFQFTRPRGARRQTKPKHRRKGGLFQFTRPRGARLFLIFRFACKSLVSIHAPARGATVLIWQAVVSTECFNSRAREGRDPNRREPALYCHRFNSRAREGRDAILFPPQDGLDVSIHAPARGATLRASGALQSCAYVSIHAPARGATIRPQNPFRLQSVSIHAPARGATIKRESNWGKLSCFNSRAREGRDSTA